MAFVKEGTCGEGTVKRPVPIRAENGELLAEADLLEGRVFTPTLIGLPKDPLDDMSHFREPDE